jgi:uncharacterized protein YbaP (TraB family)
MRHMAALCAVLLLVFPAHAAPALWRADSPTARVYLFGTMHILPKAADWLGPKITAAFDASGALWEEADIGLHNPELMARVLAEGTAQDYNLWFALNADDAAKLRAALHTCGLDSAIVTHQRPWMATMVVGICQIIAAAGGKLGPMSDNPETVLLDRAKTQNKTLGYFETAEQQIGYMESASPDAQLGQLRQAIDEAATSETEYAKTETAWLNGDVAAIATSIAPAKNEDKAFYDTIFTQRNKRFAAKIADMLKGHGTVFVAIGAGHLAGPDSVIAMLAKQGIQAKTQ